MTHTHIITTDEYVLPVVAAIERVDITLPGSMK